MFTSHFVETNHMIYIITSSPDTSNISNYKDLLQTNDVKCVIRTFVDLYDASVLKNDNIDVYDIIIEDGGIPSDIQIKQFISLIEKYTKYGSKKIAMHCASGLGRAPLLACIAIIYFDNKDARDAILFIRSIIRNALNRTQIQFLLSYKPRKISCNIC